VGPARLPAGVRRRDAAAAGRRPEPGGRDRLPGRFPGDHGLLPIPLQLPGALPSLPPPHLPRHLRQPRQLHRTLPSQSSLLCFATSR